MIKPSDMKQGEFIGIDIRGETRVCQILSVSKKAEYWWIETKDMKTKHKIIIEVNGRAMFEKKDETDAFSILLEEK